MCYYTFLNEKLLQRYTFFMIYANLFAKKCGEPTFLCESVKCVKAKVPGVSRALSAYNFRHVVSLIFSIRLVARHRFSTMLMDEPLTDCPLRARNLIRSAAVNSSGSESNNERTLPLSLEITSKAPVNSCSIWSPQSSIWLRNTYSATHSAN